MLRSLAVFKSIGTSSSDNHLATSQTQNSSHNVQEPNPGQGPQVSKMSAVPSRSQSFPPLRSLLSSIITSLAAIQPTQDLPGAVRQGSALHSRSSSRQSLLAALHVLYPTIVLQALDLLDRRLVTKILLEPSPGGTGESGTTDPGPEDFGRSEEPRNSFYLVHSAQSTRPRRSDAVSDAGLGKSYIVRLQAWNCTCAAFTFSAFPASKHGFSSRDFGGRSTLSSNAGSAHDAQRQGFGRGDDRREERSRVVEGEENREWEFGGLSYDGSDGGGVPCCKHLMACLLVEREGGPRDSGGWEGYFGNGVGVRRVGREELAGLEGE